MFDSRALQGMRVEDRDFVVDLCRQGHNFEKPPTGFRWLSTLPLCSPLQRGAQLSPPLSPLLQGRTTLIFDSHLRLSSLQRDAQFSSSTLTSSPPPSPLTLLYLYF